MKGIKRENNEERTVVAENKWKGKEKTKEKEGISRRNKLKGTI
jgi:hypothetical protein